DGIRDRNVTGVQTCALPIYNKNYIKRMTNRQGGISGMSTNTTNRIIGYARVSTDRQDEALQVDALERYARDTGRELVLYTDKVTSRRERPQLNEAMEAMTKGDLCVVYKLDRLAR